MNWRHQTKFTAKDIHDWHFWTNKGFEDQFYEIYDMMDAGMRVAIRPYDDWVSVAVPALMRSGHHVEIVTANNVNAIGSIKEWVRHHIPEANKLDVVAIGRGPAERKLKMNYDIYIDDSPELAHTIGDYPTKQMLLANAPWNGTSSGENIEDWVANVTRFNSWQYVPLLVKDIERKLAHHSTSL